MDILIRRAALRATAKVALSLTVVGCSAQVEKTPDEQEAYRSDDGATDGYTDDYTDGNTEGKADSYDEPVEEQEDCSGDDELACGLTSAEPDPASEIVLDDDQLTCCSDLLEPLLPNWEEETSWDAWTAVQGEPEVRGCCDVTVAHVNADWEKVEQIGYAGLNACCGALDFPMGPACTPWGPPPPPALNGALPELPPLEVA